MSFKFVPLSFSALTAYRCVFPRGAKHARDGAGGGRVAERNQIEKLKKQKEKGKRQDESRRVKENEVNIYIYIYSAGKRDNGRLVNRRRLGKRGRGNRVSQSGAARNFPR